MCRGTSPIRKRTGSCSRGLRSRRHNAWLSRTRTWASRAHSRPESRWFAWRSEIENGLSTPKTQHTQEEAAHQALGAEDHECDAWYHEAKRAGGLEITESSRPPVRHGSDSADQSREEHRPGDRETELQRDVAECCDQLRIGGEQPLAHGEYLGERPEQDELGAEDRGGGAVEHCVHVESHATDHYGTGHEREPADHADQHQQRAGQQEEVLRTVQQEKAEMTPAVAPAPKMWRTASAVACEARGHFGHTEPASRGVRDHLAGEFHPRRAQSKAEDGVASEATHAAMKIPDGAPEEQSSNRGQDRIAEVTVQGGHRSGRDAPLKPIAHHQIEALTKLG